MVTNQSASLSINVIKIDIDHVPLAFPHLHAWGTGDIIFLCKVLVCANMETCFCNNTQICKSVSTTIFSHFLLID